MSLTIKKPNIYQYFNYREYLAKLFEYYKSISSVFSHRYIVLKAGFKSPSALRNVINGKRHLSLESAEKFATAFKLEKKEKEYFVALVKFNTAKSEIEKERYFEELLKLRVASPPHKLTDEQLEILGKWWNVVIREITGLPDFRNSSLWISRIIEPSIPPKEVAKSLNLLKKYGLIRKTEKGWEPTSKTLQTAPEVHHHYARQFHKEMIQLGIEAISRFNPELREISSTTLRISKEDIPRVKKLLQNFRLQLLDFAASSENADQIYQLNFQFFPLVKIDRPKRFKKDKNRKSEL
ncbi:MAG: TIGR02147 family protein [Chitinispirillaceae bacterium]|nr:TIGR02147 family protein [Chitinispirillaceae bacterium]